MDKLITDKNKIINYLIFGKHFSKQDAEDLYQDTIIICLEKGKFDFNWFFTCLSNLCKEKRRNIQQDVCYPIDYNQDVHEEQISRDCDRKKIMGMFTGKAKEIVHYQIMGYSYKEISQTMGIPENSVRVILTREKERIRKTINV